MKITITEMNITVGINSRFENAGKSEFENIAIETTQSETERKKTDENMNRAPVSCATPSNGLI